MSYWNKSSEKLRLRLRWPGVLLLCCGWFVGQAAVHATGRLATSLQDAASRPLIRPLLGAEYRRELTGSAVDHFEFDLAANEFLNVVLETREVTSILVATIYDPAGQVQAESEYHSAGWQQQIAVIAPQTGRYRLLVKLPTINKGLGIYRLRILAQRPAQTADQQRLHWQRTLTGIERLEKKVQAATWQQIYADLNALRARGLDPTSEIELLHTQAALLFEANQKSKASESAQAAWQLAQRIGDKFRAAPVLNSLGLFAHTAAQLPQALDYYQQALQAARAVKNQSAEGFAAMNSGAIRLQTGEVLSAIELFQSAYTCWQAEHDESGRLLALSNLGSSYLQIGELQTALDYHLRSINETGPDRRTWRSNAELGAAYSYYVIGDFAAARTYYQRALDDSTAPRTQGPMLAGLGAVAAQLGDHAAALTYYQQALERVRNAGDYGNEVLTLGAMGLLHEAQGRHEAALKYLQEALALARRTFNKNQEALGLAKLGAIFAALQQPDAAREHFTQALTLSQKIYDQQIEAEARLGLARLARTAGAWDSARAHSEAALQLIETGRRKIASHAVRSAYFASLNQHYEFYIDLLQEGQRRAPTQGLAALAFQASERARARSLVEMLAEARVDLREGVAPALLAREHELQQTLNAANEAQFQLLNRLHLKSQADALRQRITSLTVELNEAQARIRAASPRYAALAAPAPLSAADLQSQLDADTVLLEYALGEKRSYLWAVTQDSLTSYELPPRAELETQALRVRQLLTARQPLPHESEAKRAQRLAAADASYQAEAAKLSRLLLAPAAAQLNKSRLAIVADGSLQYVPFAALPADFAPNTGSQLARRNPLLVVKYEIVHLPSASTLAFLRRERQARAAATKTLAVFADPVFEADDPRLQGKTTASSILAQTAPVPREADWRRSTNDLPVESDAPAFGRLLSSRREAKRLLAFVPQAAQRLAALDFAAHRHAAFDRQLAQYRFVHFATHGVLNEAHPELSGIVLSLRDENGTAQDGFLRLHEIYQLKLNAELVTLSACQTGLGKQVRGEGMIGLTRGFMYAGAARVAASLWKVQDDATAELMHEFYKAMLQNGQRPAAALRAAQLAMLSKAVWQQPFYWAAFVVQGDWQ